MEELGAHVQAVVDQELTAILPLEKKVVMED
jgi:hypothetical protein